RSRAVNTPPASPLPLSRPRPAATTEINHDEQPAPETGPACRTRPDLRRCHLHAAGRRPGFGWRQHRCRTARATLRTRTAAARGLCLGAGLLALGWPSPRMGRWLLGTRTSRLSLSPGVLGAWPSRLALPSGLLGPLNAQQPANDRRLSQQPPSQ